MTATKRIEYCLNPPFHISSRLLPAIKVQNTEISMQTLRWHPYRERFQYDYHIDNPDFSFYGCDIFSHENNLEKAFVSLIHFLIAGHEAYSYFLATGKKSENLDLFPNFVCEWVNQVADELTMLAYEIAGEE